MAQYICTECGGEIRGQAIEQKVGTCPYCRSLFVYPNDFPQKQRLYERAWEELRNGRYLLARRDFEYILKIDRQDIQARWGYLLAGHGVEKIPAGQYNGHPSHKEHLTFHRVEPKSFFEDPLYAEFYDYCTPETEAYYRQAADGIEKRHNQLMAERRRLEGEGLEIYLHCASQPGTAAHRLAELARETLEDAGYRIFSLHNKAGLPEEDRSLQGVAAVDCARLTLVIAAGDTDFRTPELQIPWRYAFEKYNLKKSTLITLYQDCNPGDSTFPADLRPIQGIDCGTALDSQRDQTKRQIAQRLLSAVNSLFGRTNLDSEANKRIRALREQARTLRTAGNYERAKQCYLQLAELNSKEAEAYWGIFCCLTKDLKEAVFSEEVDQNYTYAVRFARGTQKEEWRKLGLSLMEEPAWKTLMEATDDLKNTSVADLPEVQALCAHARAFLSRPEREQKLAAFEKLAKRDKKILELAGEYRRRNGERQPLFWELQQAEEKLKDKTFQMVSPGGWHIPKIFAVALIYFSTILFKYAYPALSSNSERASGIGFVALILLLGAVLLCFVQPKTFRGLATILVVFFFVGIMRVLFPESGQYIFIILVVLCLLAIGVGSFRWLLPYCIGGIVVLALVSFLMTCSSLVIQLIANSIAYISAVAILLILAIVVLQKLRFLTARASMKSVNRGIHTQLSNIHRIGEQILAGFSEEVARLDDSMGIPKGTAYPVPTDFYLDSTVQLEQASLTVHHQPSFLPELVHMGVFLVASVALLFLATFCSNQLYTAKWHDVEKVYVFSNRTIGVCADGTLVTAGDASYGFSEVSTWTDIVDIVAGDSFTAGLTSEGTVRIAAKSGSDFLDAEEWTDVVSISASDYLLGLTADGTVLIAGMEVAEAEEDEISWTLFFSRWADEDAEGDVLPWTDVAEVYAACIDGEDVPIAITTEGSVLCTDETYQAYFDAAVEKLGKVSTIFGQYGVFILANEAGESLLCGIDPGSCIADALATWNEEGYLAPAEVYVSNIVGILWSDGTVTAAGSEDYGSYNWEEASTWTDIVALTGSWDYNLYGLCSDGTVKAVGDDSYGQLSVTTWDNIVSLAATDSGIVVGVKEDGTCVSNGMDIYGSTYVSALNPIELLQFWFTH